MSPICLKLRTSNLTCVFPGTVRTWPLKNFSKRASRSRDRWPLSFWSREQQYLYTNCTNLIDKLNWSETCTTYWNRKLMQLCCCTCAHFLNLSQVNIFFLFLLNVNGRSYDFVVYWSIVILPASWISRLLLPGLCRTRQQRSVQAGAPITGQTSREMNSYTSFRLRPLTTDNRITRNAQPRPSLDAH